MFTETRMTWEKLSLEMDLINLEDPNTLGPILVGLNTLMSHEEPLEKLTRNLNFMSYDLISKCEDLGESDRLHILNSYFFDEKRFQILPVKNSSKIEDPWLLEFILEQRAGTPISIALLYLHLASKLNIPIYLVNHPSHCLLKWVRSGNKVNYVDLLQGGKVLTEAQLFELLNNSDITGMEDKNDLLEILPSKIILKQYFEQIYPVSFAQERLGNCHTLLNLLLKIDSNDLKSISRRAVIRKRLGLNKEALSDFKKYFSFVDRNQAPKEIKMAYYELQAYEESINATSPEGPLH